MLFLLFSLVVSLDRWIPPVYCIRSYKTYHRFCPYHRFNHTIDIHHTLLLSFAELVAENQHGVAAATPMVSEITCLQFPAAKTLSCESEPWMLRLSCRRKRKRLTHTCPLWWFVLMLCLRMKCTNAVRETQSNIHSSEMRAMHGNITHETPDYLQQLHETILQPVIHDAECCSAYPAAASHSIPVKHLPSFWNPFFRTCKSRDSEAPQFSEHLNSRNNANSGKIQSTPYIMFGDRHHTKDWHHAYRADHTKDSELGGWCTTWCPQQVKDCRNNCSHNPNHSPRYPPTIPPWWNQYAGPPQGPVCHHCQLRLQSSTFHKPFRFY